MNWKTIIAFMAVITVFVIYMYINRPARTGVVDIKAVFEHFNLTRELKDEMKRIKSSRQMRLDSLARVLSVKGTEPGLREEYSRLRVQFEVQDARLTEDYDNSIHEKLDNYLKEFAKTKKLNLLFGTEKLGAVLYADSSLDYTSEAIQFVNLKHASK